MDTADKLLSVIIPCQNEADNIPFILAELNKYAESAKIKETVVVDDASDDKTVDVAEGFAHKYPNLNITVVSRPRPAEGLWCRGKIRNGTCYWKVLHVRRRRWC